MHLPAWLLAQSPATMLLAQDEGSKGGSYGIAFALTLFCVILGCLAALRADKREEEVKKPKP